MLRATHKSLLIGSSAANSVQSSVSPAKNLMLKVLGNQTANKSTQLRTISSSVTNSFLRRSITGNQVVQQ